jgi:hypothetical protein
MALGLGFLSVFAFCELSMHQPHFLSATPPVVVQEYMRKQQHEVAKREAAEKQLAAAAAAKRQAALKALVEKQKEVRWHMWHVSSVPCFVVTVDSAGLQTAWALRAAPHPVSYEL